MNTSRAFQGLLLLFALAAIGAGLIYIPSWLVTQHEAVSKLGPYWSTVYWIAVGTGGALLLGSSGYILLKLWRNTARRKKRKKERNKNPSQLSSSQKQSEYDENLRSIDQMRSDADLDAEVQRQLDPLVNQLEYKREAQKLEIVAFGTISSGKSSVLNLLAGRNVFRTAIVGGTTVERNEIPWPGVDSVVLVDTPGLGEVDGAEHINIAANAANDADLVLLVVDGPLRESEYRLITRLREMEKKIVICLNKSDWYTPEDRQKLIGQISRQTNDIVRPEDVIAIQAEKGERTRRRVLSDGSTVDETVEVAPDIKPLADRMLSVVKRDGKDLLMANLLLQSRGLVEQAKEQVKKSLDKKAWNTVDKYMWGAGGAAAISPVPVLDLIAGAGLSTKMVMDLATIYRQPIDFQSATKLLGQLGKNLISVLGASGASTAVGAVVASMIKTVPGIGTVAGGMLQGLVQALITRWIGAVFIEYFRNEMQEPEGGLASLARRQWKAVTTTEQLRQLVKTAREKLAA
jgi:uncharacterized protein